jgi:hypothetical protein
MRQWLLFFQEFYQITLYTVNAFIHREWFHFNKDGLMEDAGIGNVNHDSYPFVSILSPWPLLSYL